MNSATAYKSPAVQRLLDALDPINVLPGHDYRLTRAGAAVLHTRPMQRLARLRQVGLGHMVWPNAENTRFSHSIGTEYWVVRFLESLRSNRHAQDGNALQLRLMDDALGADLSLELLARLFALVHDFALLPLGHTLQYQLGFYRTPGAEARRAAHCLAWVREEVSDTPELQLLPEPERSAVVRALLLHLDLVECVFCAGQLLDDRRTPALPRSVPEAAFARWLPVLTFIYDLTHAIFSADLIDFVLRDSAAAGIPRVFDARLLEHVSLFRVPAEGGVADLLGEQTVYRFGLNAADEHVHHHVVTGATALYRVRYEVAERVFYHPAKCAADAMLDRALRTIDARERRVSSAAGPFAEEALLRMGDDAFVDQVALLERETTGEAALMPQLLARRLHPEAFRVSDARELSDEARSIVARAHDAALRSDLEQRILAHLPELATGDLIFASRPLSMQVKEPDILVGWSGGAVRTLREVAEEDGYNREALEIARRYAGLWSLSVYLRAHRMDQAARVRAVCTRLFSSSPASLELAAT